jgi:D-Tyr-tRNAtyr deacylase
MARVINRSLLEVNGRQSLFPIHWSADTRRVAARRFTDAAVPSASPLVDRFASLLEEQGCANSTDGRIWRTHAGEIANDGPVRSG